MDEGILSCSVPKNDLLDKLSKDMMAISFDPNLEKNKVCASLSELAKSNPKPVEVKVVDEPTNTFVLSLEHKKNVFSFTLYHPKMLKTYLEDNSSGTTKYVPAAENIPNGDRTDFINSLPDGAKGVHIQNTRRNVVWLIGYGRNFTIAEGKKGKVVYTPKVDAGIQTGIVRTAYFEKNGIWDEKVEKTRALGVMGSVGHRLEYQKGKVAVFVDQRLQYGKVKHGFLDGTASYSSLYAPVTFGVAVDILTVNKKK